MRKLCSVTLNIANILLIICGVFAITNLALSSYLISRSFAAQHQRDRTEQIVEQQRNTLGDLEKLLKNQQKGTKSFECILLIPPQDRTLENFAKCRAEAAL